MSRIMRASLNHSQDSQTQPVTAMGHTDLELCVENDDQRL